MSGDAGGVDVSDESILACWCAAFSGADLSWVCDACPDLFGVVLQGTSVRLGPQSLTAFTETAPTWRSRGHGSLQVGLAQMQPGVHGG